MKAISWPTRDRSCKPGGRANHYQGFSRTNYLDTGIRSAVRVGLGSGGAYKPGRKERTRRTQREQDATLLSAVVGVVWMFIRKFGCWSSHAPHVAPADYNISPRAQRRHVGTTGRGGGARDALRCPEMS